MQEEEVNSSQEEEVAPHEESHSITQEEQHEQKEPNPRQEEQERNWRAARQRISELERANREKEEMLKKALEFQQSQTQSQQSEPEEEPDPDDYINYGGVKKTASKVVEPLMKEVEELKSELAQRKQQEMVQSLRTRYSDFDDVVNPETIALFEEKEPELAKQIAEINDPYKMGMQSYKFIKAFNLSEEVKPKRRQKEAVKTMEKNEKTVQSPQSYDKRPMAQAYRMTESEKNALYQEMMGFAAMEGSAPPLQ